MFLFYLSFLIFFTDVCLGSESFNVSTVFGDHMVLQRNTNSRFWGFATIGSKIQLTIDNDITNNLTTITDNRGIWTFTLPMYSAGGPHTFTTWCVKDCVNSETYQFIDIYFGDVYLCGGQSNMAYETELLMNASTELAIADNPKYHTIRLFQVGTLDTFTVPVRSLEHVEKPWTSTNHTSVANFASLCWLTGRNIFDGLNGTVPIGLISSCVSGSPIQNWVDKETLDSCASLRPHPDPCNASDSGYYNSMIAPFVLPGPLAITGIMFWQGEENLAYNETEYYSCMFPSLINSWRKAFTPSTSPSAIPYWFGYVQIQAFSQYATPEHNDTYDAPWFRQYGQLIPTQSLPNISFACTINIGDPLSPLKSIHPRDKQPVGEILGKAALYNIYQQSNGTYASPLYKSSVCTKDTTSNNWTVAVTFSYDTLTSKFTLTTPPDCPTSEGVPAADCSTYGILGSDGIWYNATAQTNDNVTLLVSAVLPEGITAVSHGYGWSVWPLTSLYAENSIVPIVPWLENCS